MAAAAETAKHRHGMLLQLAIRAGLPDNTEGHPLRPGRRDTRYAYRGLLPRTQPVLEGSLRIPDSGTVVVRQRHEDHEPVELEIANLDKVVVSTDLLQHTSESPHRGLHRRDT